MKDLPQPQSVWHFHPSEFVGNLLSVAYYIFRFRLFQIIEKVDIMNIEHTMQGLEQMVQHLGEAEEVESMLEETYIQVL